jgi:hypothetical protein
MRFEELDHVLAALPQRPLVVSVLTTCTKMKRFASQKQPAEQLYYGEQHRAVMTGVEDFRVSPRCARCDVHIVSAGFGLVSGTDLLPNYEATFSGRTKQAIRASARGLEIPEAAERWLHAPEVDLKLALLGNEYLTACAFTWDKPPPSPTVLFCSMKAARFIPELPRLCVVPLSAADARRYGQGLISLKGKLALRLLRSLAAGVPSRDVRLGTPQAAHPRAS